jgi:hypothetical protein
MTLPSKHKWISLTILAILIPTGLLAAFKLTGIIPEPPTIAQTIEKEVVTLKFDRPSKDVRSSPIANSYVDENVLINVSTSSIEYGEQSAFNNRDCVEANLWINATAFHGFVYSFEFSCNVDNASSITDGYYYYINMYNTTVAEHNAAANRIYYKFRVSNSPAAIRIPLNWIYLEGDGSVDHQLSLNVSTVHYNGTAYHKVIIPLRINVTRDVGNTFEGAKMIGSGETLGSLDLGDRVDVYALHLSEGETINLTLIPAKEANFNLYLYNQNRVEIAKSCQEGNQTEAVTYKANQTGIYYIKLENLIWDEHWSTGIYQLKIEVFEAEP